MTTQTHIHTATGLLPRFSPLKALLRADRNYRERQQLMNLTDEQLKDVGLTREDLR